MNKEDMAGCAAVVLGLIAFVAFMLFLWVVL